MKNNENNINNNKLLKINEDFKSQNFIYIKKLKNIFIAVVLIFALLLGRLGYLQFIQGSYLKELAYKQQTINQIISPKRGSIYDSTGKTLATSASVDTITINPEKIKDFRGGQLFCPPLKLGTKKPENTLFSGLNQW